MNNRPVGSHLPLDRQFDLHLQLLVDRGRPREAYDKFARTHDRKIREIGARFYRVHPKARVYYEAPEMGQLVHQIVWLLIQQYQYRCPETGCDFRGKTREEWEAHVIVDHAGADLRPKNDVGRFVRIGIRRALLKEMVKVYRKKRTVPELWDDQDTLERAAGGRESNLDDHLDAHRILEEVGDKFDTETVDAWAGGLVERGKAKGKRITAAARKFAEAR